MNTYKLSNIPLSDFRDYLEWVGCICVQIHGGHEKWTKEGLTRPIIIQTHIDPIPEFIIKNCLRALGVSKKQYFEYLKSKSKAK